MHCIAENRVLVLTSRDVVPRSTVDDVVVADEVLIVARPPVGVGHHLQYSRVKRLGFVGNHQFQVDIFV